MEDRVEDYAELWADPEKYILISLPATAPAHLQSHRMIARATMLTQLLVEPSVTRSSGAPAKSSSVRPRGVAHWFRSRARVRFASRQTIEVVSWP